jgi:hypothetical protein
LDMFLLKSDLLLLALHFIQHHDTSLSQSAHRLSGP